MARKQRNEKGDVWVFISDGELEEGQTYEALQAIAVRQLRRRDDMDVSRLAAELRVPEDELRAIEADQGFVPKPRTIHQIARYYKISARALLKLSPAAAERDPNLDEVAVRFAASSESLSKLSRDERKKLNEFIKVLSDYKEHPEDAD